MPRPHQQLRRVEIAARLSGIATERKELERQDQALNGSSSPAAISRRLQVIRALTALAEEVTDLNYELHVRNTPSLSARFGPGAD